tara:strand:+ start:375 stop:563 length:189 start_codon:yes stop_codon:yes gene_type:complete
MLLSEKDYLKKHGEVARVLFEDKVGWNFEHLDELDDFYRDKWTDCVLSAMTILELLDIGMRK